MKRRAVITNVTDPQNFGRIRAKLIRFDDSANSLPWCWPCTALAGPLYGLYILPKIGDEVYVEKTEDGDWVWTGFYWSDRNKIPEDAADEVRLLRTPNGHQIKLDDNGEIKLEHSNGSYITLKSNGDIEIQAKANVMINDDGTCRTVNTKSICAFTGLPHPQGSKSVFTEKP